MSPGGGDLHPAVLRPEQAVVSPDQGWLQGAVQARARRASWQWQGPVNHAAQLPSQPARRLWWPHAPG